MKGVRSKLKATKTVEKVRIVIVDDHSLLREGLKRILNMEPDFEVVAECGDGNEVVEVCNEVKPDVVLMDINMPEQNGVITTERMREAHPDIKVIILSIHDDESYVFETLRKGATGYLLKDMESSELIHAIRSVVNGYAYIHPKVTGKLIHQLRRMTYLDQTGLVQKTGVMREGAEYVSNPMESPLTRREAEVLRLMAEGKNNRVIAESLYISEKTVKNHVSSILQKLSVNDRTQAVINSIKKGWVRI